MIRSEARLVRGFALTLAAALALSACGPAATSPGQSAAATTPAAASPGQSGAAASPAGSPAGEGGQPGGTIFMLTANEQFNQVDPQRAYTGEDIAFFGATIYRSLVAFTVSKDDASRVQLVPDLATDLGTADRRGQDLELHPP